NCNDGANWLGGNAPTTAGADALLFDGSTRTSNTNNFTDPTFGGITFTSGAGAFTLGGNAIHLSPITTGFGITNSADILNNSTNTQTINNAIILEQGKHVIASTVGLNLNGAITRSVRGSSVQFSPGAGNINVT